MKSFEKVGDGDRDLRTRDWTGFRRVRSSPRDMAEAVEVGVQGLRAGRTRQAAARTKPRRIWDRFNPASRASAMLRKIDPAEENDYKALLR